MNDRAVSLLEQYEIEVLRIRKGRGAFICETARGDLIFKEYAGNEEKIAVQNQVLAFLNQREDVSVEEILPTAEGELFVKDNDGVKYILKTYREGRECNAYEKEECGEAVKFLARLHKSLEFMEEPEAAGLVFSQEKEYEKHNRELKKVRKYLQQRSQKTWFEIRLLNTFDYFLDQALAVTAEWKEYQAKSGTKIFCHGDFQYHNILHCGQEWFIINFEKCIKDDPIRDLYLFLRKILEKSNWSVELGKSLLAEYETIRSISAISRIDLYYRLAYPEKFWKIANFYYNSGKAWIPERNQQKLEKLLIQEQEKQQFLNEVFRNLS